MRSMASRNPWISPFGLSFLFVDIALTLVVMLQPTPESVGDDDELRDLNDARRSQQDQLHLEQLRAD